MQSLTRSLDVSMRTLSGKVTCETLSFGLVKGSFQDLLRNKNQFLHIQEEEVFSGYDFDLKKYSYLLGRLAAKKALKQHEEELFRENEYLILNGSIGEPVLLNRNLHISIAHTAPFGLAVASSPMLAVGVDIECPSHFHKIKPSVFSDNERQLFTKPGIPFDEELAKCLLWSAKESLVKLIKTGFTIPFNLLEIASVEVIEDIYYAIFKNFPAFQVLLFKSNNLVVGISVHKNVKIFNTSMLLYAANEFCVDDLVSY